ncbi:MAG: methyl-accepting chemotaxis protein, partial [Deferribacterota bacterium]|nr:methyl-accepting chemotaxis protein [Deferribacterota bacterium]
MDKISFRHKLSTKFIIRINILILILLIIFSITIYITESKKSMNEYKATAQTLVNGIAGSAYNFLSETMHYTTMLAEYDDIKRLLVEGDNETIKKRVKDILEKAMNYLPEIHNIALVDLDKNSPNYGNIIETADYEELIGVSVLDEDWVRHIDQHPYYISDVFIEKVTKKPVITFNIPIYYSKRLIGAIELLLYQEYFYKRFTKQFSLGKDTYFFIGDSRGEIISHPLGREAVLNKDFEKKVVTIINNILAGKNYFTYTFKGVKKHYFQSKPVDLEHMASKWYVSYGVPEETIYASVYSFIKNLFIFTIILFFILSFGISLLFHLFVNKPLATINNSLRDISSGQGDLTKKLPVKGKDEFSLLANYYNRFIDTISHIIREVKDLSNTISSM